MLKIRVVKAMLRVTAAAAISLLVTFSALAQTIRYMHTDVLGSVVLVTDKDRNIVERSEYEPYGGLLNRPITDGPGYTGHVTDAVTGLSYMQQRYYDPQVGLFLSVDPVTTYSTPTGAFNRYWYANNNPYKFTDPDGRQSQVPSTGVPVFDWLTASSDAQGSAGQMMEKQLAFELSQPHSVKDVVLYTAIAMSAGTGAAGGTLRGASSVLEVKTSVLTVEAKAAQLASRVGANSVTIKTAGGQIRYDLLGDSHFSKALKADVPTPHVVTYKNNIIPSGPRAGTVGNVSQVGDTVPATMQDMRTIERVLDQREK